MGNIWIVGNSAKYYLVKCLWAYLNETLIHKHLAEFSHLF